MSRSVAVIGGGWAGLAAAVEATRRGHSVTLYEMAAQLGGRARTVSLDGHDFDNGQHILIGAYVQTLALMRTVGADEQALLWRSPLRLRDPAGHGLALPPGAPVPAFLRAVLSYRGWGWRDKTSLLGAALSWGLRGFRSRPDRSVAELCQGLTPRLRAELIEPLCVAALNTPAADASASVFLRVLRDALFGTAGSSDLLLPRAALGRLLPEPAERWLRAQGAELQLGQRIGALGRDGARWQVDGRLFDAVILAATAGEAARLARPFDAEWSAQAQALAYQPIVTVYARSEGARLAEPMLALPPAGNGADGAEAAQFVFDLGRLKGTAAHDGLLAFVISGARGWLERGAAAATEATLAQGTLALRGMLGSPLRAVQTITEKRATFACTPNLQRPPARIVGGLWAAGDYVAGPYPATLEGAVRSGLQAATSLSFV